MSERHVVVVDIGSNSTRLFLCDGVDAAGPRGERITTITALRRGAGSDGSIAADALGRFDDCLTRFGATIDAFGADEVIAVGTSAVRDAPNRDRVAAIVRKRLGADLRVLAGAHEAELSYVGARLATSGDGAVIVMDIGGGSTELVRGDASGPTSAVSLDVGGVRFTDLFLHDDPPTAAQVRAVRDEAAGLVIPALAALGGPAPMLGVAGTMTTIAAIANGGYDPEHIHGMVLATGEVHEITDHLDLSQYNTSKHLRVLKHAGIVDVRALGQRREYFIAKTFRRRLARAGPTLDFGCCTFRFDKLPD